MQRPIYTDLSKFLHYLHEQYFLVLHGHFLLWSLIITKCKQCWHRFVYRINSKDSMEMYSLFNLLLGFAFEVSERSICNQHQNTGTSYILKTCTEEPNIPFITNTTERKNIMKTICKMYIKYHYCMTMYCTIQKLWLNIFHIFVFFMSLPWDWHAP